MKKLLAHATPLLALLLSAHLAFGQAIPFWTENFTNGFPAGWTNEDPSPNDAFWTWCSDPFAGDAEAGCPEIWNTPNNQQKAFAATTAATGFVTLDSDDYGELGTNHLSEMTTSAIDCSDKNEVWITFQTHIGVFNHTADDDAVLRVSTDKQNWTEYQIFYGLTSSVRWSDNPEIPIIDISATAASQTTVYIQWQWDGNYDYHWSIDDVELYDKNPTPLNDLAISRFFYPAASYATPQSQVADDVFGFNLHVSNKGLDPQTGVWAHVRVENETGFLLHADSVQVGSLAVGVADSLVEFPKSYTPDLVEGRYFVKYSVRASAADGRPNNNATSSEFLVTTGQFAKEKRAEQGIRPAASDLDPVDTWLVGNYYRMGTSSLETFVARSADFAFTTDETELAVGDVEATVYLLKANPDIDDDLSNLDDTNFLSSFEILGLSVYEAPDTLQDNLSIQNIEIIDFANGTPGVTLEAGARYLLAVTYSGTSKLVYHSFNNDNNYYFTSTLVYTNQWSTFGEDANAVLRLNMSLFVSTDDRPLPEKALSVFPSPANSVVNLGFDFEKPTDATITIAHLDGRVINFQDRQGLTNERIPFNVGHLASGTYLARVATAAGTRTVKFAVAH